LLEGKSVNLRAMEKDDVDFVVDCSNDINSYEYDPITQVSRTEKIKEFDNPTQLSILTERGRFIIEKKDGTKIGYVFHFLVQPLRWMEIGYFIISGERGKGYGTEAVQIMVDYLFLSRDLVRIQALTNMRNKASQKVLENAGFKREGTVRKSAFVRGAWADAYIYSILREEWKEPRMLTKTTSQS